MTRPDQTAPEARPRRVLVVSHPATVPVNQEVYLELVRRGADVTIAVPSSWRHEYASGMFQPAPLRGLEGRLLPLRVALPGRPQRHFYLARPKRVLQLTEPDVVFVEAEPFSAVAAQWAVPLSHRGVPFGVQCAENIDRAFPKPVRTARGFVLQRAAFVAARSASAAELARRWGALGTVGFAPHAVPAWPQREAHNADGRPFTIGYAGRLAPEKGLRDLVAAARRLSPTVELLLAGDGPLRPALAAAQIPGQVRVRTGLRHDEMAGIYDLMDVLVLPSRTTAHWKEQFGRVIVEALSCGVPVVGSDSGEIPWLIHLTGGGVTFPEGDVDALATCLTQLRDQPERRVALAANGRAAVERMFTVAAATDALYELLNSADPRPASPAARRRL